MSFYSVSDISDEFETLLRLAQLDRKETCYIIARQTSVFVNMQIWKHLKQNESS